MVLLGRSGRGAAEACDDGPHSWAAAVSRVACDAAVLEDMCQAPARSHADGEERCSVASGSTGPFACGLHVHCVLNTARFC